MVYNALQHENVAQSDELSYLAFYWEKDRTNPFYNTKNIDNLYAKAIYLQIKNDFGQIMPSHTFYELVEDGFLTDYDCHGVFIDWDGNKKESVHHNPHNIKQLKIQSEKYPFVIWFMR